MQHCTTTNLPIHPRTGLTALGVMSSGRIVWPILGGAPDEYTPPGTQAELDAIVQERIARDRRQRDTGNGPPPGVTPERLAEMQEAERQWRDAQSEQARAQRQAEIDAAKAEGKSEGEQVWKPALLQSALERHAREFGINKADYLAMVDTNGIDLKAGAADLDDANKALLTQRLEARKTANPELFGAPAPTTGTGGSGRPAPDPAQGSGQGGDNRTRGEDGKARATARAAQLATGSGVPGLYGPPPQ